MMISGNALSSCSPAELEPAESTAKNNRLFVETVLYCYRVGIPWRDPPERFGNFRVIHTRHTCWIKCGLCQRVFEVWLSIETISMPRSAAELFEPINTVPVQKFDRS